MAAGPAAAGGRAHVFVDDLEHPAPAEADRRHLERVLRLRPGEAITVSDGRGGWRPCRFGPELAPDGPVEHVARAHPVLTVAAALTKGERPEWTVQKLTEVGIDEIVLFVAQRSVVRWDDERGSRTVERLRRVAREAAMQSRRAWLADVALGDFADLCRRPDVALADIAGGPPSLAHPTVLVGPEGGWSDEERAVLLPRITLGPQVLRSETAAIGVGVVLAALRAGLLIPHTDVSED